MGSGVSSSLETPGGDLRLPNSGLRFTRTQLQHLNAYVDNLYQQDQLGRMSPDLESTVESLVQRIVDGAGQRDPRFRCCHLIALHRGKKMRSRSLEYLVPLESLGPGGAEGAEGVEGAEGAGCRLVPGPAGHARARLAGRRAHTWEDCLSAPGDLCRDKVVSRWVELIAKCASARGGGSTRVLHAGAGAAAARPLHYCYLERSSPPQTSPAQRLAIVEGAAWVMVRVGAGAESAGSEAEAKLLLAVRVEGSWPETRVPFTHPMAMLHYSVACEGYYAVAVGPPSSQACTDRQGTWQLWNPVLEASLDAHYADQSTVGRIAGALNALVDRLRDGVVQGSLRLLSRESVRRSLRRRLHQTSTRTTAASRACVSAHASHHFLLVVDDLIAICSDRGSQLPRRGMRASDTDWAKDASCLMNLLRHLHVESESAEEIPPRISESLEMTLFRRWENLLKEMKASNTSTPNYSRQQLRYIGRLASELLKCKARTICENQSTFRANLIQAMSVDQEPIEDLIHVLAIMLDQARDLYLSNNFPQSKQPTSNVFERDVNTYRSKKWNKLKEYYDASSACLIDAVRRDIDLRKENLTEDCTVIKNVLNWLYKGAKDDKKYLGPVLKPYLESLFTSSLENAMFLEDFDSKKCVKEFEGLKNYCLAVHEGKVEPCMGLLEMGKKMAWAKAMVDFVDRSRHVDLRLVFPTGGGMAVSYAVKLPSRRDSSARALTLNRRDKAEARLRLARRCVLAAFTGALIGERSVKPKEIRRYGSTDEILASVKSGHYWRNSTKPDIIPGPSQDPSDLPRVVRRRSRRSRPTTTYGYPEISISNQTDAKSMRRKYHTVKSLVYTEPVESIKELRQRPRSAGSTMRSKEAMSRPSILETLDFINGVKDALCVEESGTSDVEDVSWSANDEWLLGQSQPLNVLTRLTAGDNLHNLLSDVVVALLYRGKFTILQELCTYLGESSEGALFALHRLARAARSRSSERPSNSWQLPEAEGVALEPWQTYRARPPDQTSGDEAPPPPPLPRTASRTQISQRKYSDFNPPKRLQELENHLKNLELMNAKLNLSQNLTRNYPNTNILNDNYTGIINPIYDEKKIPKDKFSAKRSKSLGRSFSTRKLGIEISRYNLTLGHKSGQRTNDVVTAIMETTGETGLETKSNFFQRYSSAASVVGDSYKMSRVTID